MEKPIINIISGTAKDYCMPFNEVEIIWNKSKDYNDFYKRLENFIKERRLKNEH